MADEPAGEDGRGEVETDCDALRSPRWWMSCARTAAVGEQEADDLGVGEVDGMTGDDLRRRSSARTVAGRGG